MKLYWRIFCMVIQKFILRRNTGVIICDFAEKMGVVYIKMAQILAMQNYGQVFNEEDRRRLSKICDHCNPISFSKIRQIIDQEYQGRTAEIFKTIDPEPIGSASISQVHRAKLKDGRQVVLKVKREDVVRSVKHDVRQIRRLIHAFGHFAKFRNFLGSDQALKLWADWILEETDFTHEYQNISRYQQFANSVNGKVPGKHYIKLPKSFPEFCTDKIIVMEFIAHPTINHLKLTNDNKQKIQTCVNDYLALSFYAMFHDMPVVFHGDPHSGNLYIDSTGNVGFLDMGLIFEFTANEAQLLRQLFLYSYTCKTEPLIDLLIQNSRHADYDRTEFIHDMGAEIARLQNIPVTQYFIEMMNVFTKYNISPPTFIFKAAKAFLALYGMNTIIGNLTSTKELLASQVIEYYATRSFQDIQTTFNSGLNVLPKLIEAGLQDDIWMGLAASAEELKTLRNCFATTLAHFDEIIDLMGR